MNKTLVKNLFDKSGGALAGTGAVSYMFKSLGEIKIKSKNGNVDEEMLYLLYESIVPVRYQSVVHQFILCLLFTRTKCKFPYLREK